jgi:large subunit ribosomal protein L25
MMMAETMTLAAELRTRSGKGGARAARRAGRTPGIIYGNQQEPVMISLNAAELTRQVRRPGFLNHVFELDLGGRKERVLPREVQNHPLSGLPLHVDFMRFSEATTISVEVEVRFENEDKSPGLKRGGVLNVVMRTVEVVCRPDAIPEFLSVDLAGLNVGDVVHIDALTLPPGVELGDTGEDATIASIAAPSTEELPAAAEPEDSAEGEAAS